MQATGIGTRGSRSARSAMPISSDLDACLGRTREWLSDAFQRTADAAGWGHSAAEQEPSEWGGTLDGIRGLLALGEPPMAPVIADSVRWLKTRQREDGGFGARELNYSAAEATAWVVITLARLGLRTDNDSVVAAAVDYLQHCVDASGGAATTPGDVDQPRALPTALTLWALALQPGTEHISSKIVNRLRMMQDSESGGWGVRFGATPNAATTAQVLHALRQARVSEGLDWVIAGVQYLLARQEDDGSWRNSHDEWFTHARPRIPVRCAHFGTGWALLALTGFDSATAQAAAAHGAAYLIDHQRPSGAWLLEDFDPTEYVWCTTQVAVALADWRQRAAQNPAPARPARPGRDLVASLIAWVRAEFLYLAVAALAVAQLHGVIERVARQVARFIRVEAGSVWTNVISSAIWALLVVGGGLLAKFVTHDRNLGRQPGDRR